MLGEEASINFQTNCLYPLLNTPYQDDAQVFNVR